MTYAAMPHRLLLSHAADTVAWATTGICTAIATFLLTIAPAPDYEELRNLLIPLISGAFFCCGVMYLNPNVETKRIITGRFMIALPLGCTIPHLVTIWKPEWSGITSHAIVLLPAGGLSTAAIYILSYPFFRGAYQRSRATAELILNEVERTARIQRKDDVKDAMVEAVNGTIADAMSESTSEATKVAKAVIASAIPAAKELVVEAAIVAAEKLKKESKS